MRAATVVSLLVCALATAAAAQLAPEEQMVISVRVLTEAGAVVAEDPADLPLVAGRPYTGVAVRASLQHLYRSGLYSDIRAEAHPAPGGVRVDFICRQNFYINQVRVTGLRPPPGIALAMANLRLPLGQPFRETDLEDALERLRAALREEGLYEAEIEVALDPREDTRQMDVTVHITPGTRARFGQIDMDNQTDISVQALLARSKLKTGDEATSARLDRAGDRIRKLLTDRGHLSARVNIRRGDYDAAARTVPIELEVLAGPKVRVEVAGARISQSTLRRLLPIYQESAVDFDLLQEGRRDLRDYLESEGYFDSEVDVVSETDPEEDVLVITYRVERGPRRRLAGVAVEGNRYFGNETLLSRMRLRPAGFLDRGRYSERLMRADEGSLRALYVANGFSEVQVSSEVIEDYAGREGDLFVRFRVVEGSQTLISELILEGNELLDEDYLLARVDTTPGQPFSEANVIAARNNILATYFNEGFPEARFSWEAEQANPSDGVRLTYRIVEGRRLLVKRVLIDGNEHTRHGVIARELRIGPGDPLGAERVAQTQRELYNLGVFSRVAIAPQNPEGLDPDKNVVVLVEEARRYTLSYGGGFEVQRLGGAGTDPVGGEIRVSPRGLFEISKANFGGRAHTLSFRGRASTLQHRALLSYTAPSFLAKRSLSLLMTGFADKTSDVRTFTSTRYEGSVQLAQEISRVTSLLYRYSYRRVLVDADSLRVSPDQIPLFSQPTRISALGASWIRERRDNPADATVGDFNTVDLSLAMRPIGSSATFLRFFGQNSTYHPVGARARRITFARSFRIGIQEPLGQTLPTDIPLPERFFVGGGQTLRGFGLNQAGPRNEFTGFPVGGLALLVANHELRFPMRLPWAGRMGGALFYDVGNVFARTNRISFRVSPSRESVESGELNYLSHTVGFSFRYPTPIGPVRLDLGYLLNPATFEFCAEGVSNGPRCPPGQGLRQARLSRFQFFFNIGSMF
jgi:outer membrane protein insertion porin family